MKALGIVRKLDELGRVVIPMEFRKVNGWEAGEPIEMFADGDKLVIQSYKHVREKQEVINTLTEMKQELSQKQKKQLDEVINYLKGVR